MKLNSACEEIDSNVVNCRMYLVRSKTTKSRYNEKNNRKKLKKTTCLAAHTDEMINVKSKNESNFLKTVFRINKKTEKKVYLELLG